jgi:hypothetical protein
MRTQRLYPFIAVVLFLGAVTSRAGAVVPYPLSVEDETSSLPQEAHAGSTSPATTRQILDQLAADELRLQAVLQDLKQARETLQQAESKTKSEQETHNGLSLR